MSKVTIDRELLERIRELLDIIGHRQDEYGVEAEYLGSLLKKVLAQPAQQGEVVEVVGYRFFHVDHGYIFRRTHIYEGNPSLEAHSLMTVAQHERILAASVPAGCKVVPVELLKSVLREYDQQVCTHEETYRGGAIWEICSICGTKWADDEGGKPEFKWPDAIEQLRALLASAGGGER